MRRLGRLALAAALGGAVLGAPSAATAVLTASASETNTFSAGTLSTPGSVQTVHPNVTGSGDGDVRLTWSQSLTRAVTYLVQRAPAASPTTWSTVNGTGTSSGALCTGTVPGTVSCSYDDNATNSSPAPAYNASYTYQVVAKVGGWTQPSSARFAGSLPPTSGSETYLVPPDLNAVSAASGSAVWAVGANCTVDFFNGSTWTLQTVPTAVCPTGTSLNGVDANGGLPMVVGSGGVTFICTASCTAAAPTWSAKSTPGSPTLYAVSANTATAMWAVGAGCSLLYYNGTTWTAVAVATAQCPAGSNLYGVDANAGKPIAAGAAGTLFTCTANCLGTGTPTLTTNTPASLAGATFYAVTVFSTSAVWAVGSSGAVAVCTGSCTGTGASWVAQTSGTTATLRAVGANSATLVDVAGDAGTILQCTVSCNKAAGYAWAAKVSNTSEDLTGILVGTGAAIGVGRLGTIVTLGGWAPMATNETDDLDAISAVSATSAWAVGPNCTVDYYNGSTWTVQAVPVGVCPAGTALHGVDANGGQPMVVGSGGVTFLCTAACTSATPTWSAKATPGSPSLYAVSANSATAMWAVGANCSLLYFNGTAWSAVTVATANCPAGTTLYAVEANGGKPIAGGAAGTLFTCTTSCLGTGTPTLTTNTPASLTGATFYGLSTISTSGVWAVGSGGAIAVCVSSCTGTGATWAAQSSGTTGTLRGVSSSTTSLVDVVGDAGTILQCSVSCNKATGYAWASQASQTVENLYGVYLVSASQAYVVGANGTAAGVGTGAFAVVLVTALPVNVPVTYTLLGADLTQLSTPDGSLYPAHAALPTTALPGTCTAPTPGLRVRPSSTVPAGSWALAKAVATVVLQVDNAPSGGAAFQLLVSPDNGSSWTSYPVTPPTAAGTPVRTSVDVTAALGSTTAIATTQLCLQGTSGTGPLLTTSVDLLHLDVG